MNRPGLILCITCLLGALAHRSDGQETSSKSFFEDFDTLSGDTWRISDGWSNGKWQNCTWSRRNVSVADSILTLSITEAPEGQGYSCGEIQTRERFGHGTYEVRMKTGRGSGMNAAFFTYIGPIHDAPHHEIDVEILTRDTSQVSLNTYVDGDPHGGSTAVVPGGTEADFVHYVFEWSDERIRWYVNGIEVHEATGTLPDEAMKIWLSYWGTETLTAWMGRFDPAALPVHLEVDWVAFTEPGERCRFPQSFTCDRDTILEN